MMRAFKPPIRKLKEPLTRIISFCLDVDDPWRLGNEIVEQAAVRYEADISTLFRVVRVEGEDWLILKGGVLFYPERRLPTDIVYKLDWSARSWDDPKLEKKGLTSAVVVLNQELAIDDYKELESYPAHKGRWDWFTYPDGVDDPRTGFRCLHAVPLRLHDRGEPKDTVVGVFKIERRRNRDKFNTIERAAFTVVATHLNQILRTSEQVKQLINEHVEHVLSTAPEVGSFELERRVQILSTHDKRLQALGSSGSALQNKSLLKDLEEELPEAREWIEEVSREVRGALGYEPRGMRRLFVVISGLKVEPTRVVEDTARPRMLEAVEKGFAKAAVSPQARETALRNLERWLVAPTFDEYREQLEWLIKAERWEVLLDSFYRVLPFGTGGRRGPVGIGTNRFNPFTLKSSVQGHAKYLRERYPDQDWSVVIAYDVRVFNDLRGVYNPTLPNPLLGITSKDFAHLAAGVYAANNVRVHMLPVDSKTFISTPELSFTIRRLGANGGLNVSASHNHPDDNGGKFYDCFGGQEVPPSDEEMAQHVENVENIASLSLAEVREAGLLQWISPEVHEEYVALNLEQSLHPEARNACIVFTPLHGTGETTVGEVLRRAGFDVRTVVEQAEPDGSFPGVPFRAPNPEVSESMRAGVDLAAKIGADVVMACDPDADRIGVCSKDPDQGYTFLSGSEIAVLVTHYKLEALKQQNRLPAVPLVIKTEVTTELLRAITEDFGGTIIGDLLVGFKYHANVLNQLKQSGRFTYPGQQKYIEATEEDFVVAVEESHGVLVTPKLRDKDAAGAAILIAELAALQRARNQTLVDYLDEIYLRYGYYANLGRSLIMSGAVGFDSIQKIQDALRKRAPSSICGWKVVDPVVDHLDPRGLYGALQSGTDRAARNVLVFRLENDARVILRPSGTEPKSKIYVEVRGPVLGVGAGRKALRAQQAEVDSIAARIADDFMGQMLDIIDARLPDYALRISDLVPLDKRIEFVRDFLPGLDARARELCAGQASREAVSEWIDKKLQSYGQDARGLVANAVKAYLDTRRRESAGLAADQAQPLNACLDAAESFFLQTSGS